MRARTAAFVVAAALAGTTVTLAQSGTQTRSGYRLPPKAVVDIVDAAPLPTVEVSPAGDVLAILPRRSQLSIAEMSQPMLRLAGMRINPANNGPHRAPMTTGITLRSIATGVERAVQVPAGARIGSLSFSPDGKRFSFTNTRDARIDLYVADAATAQAHLVEGAVNAIGDECEWLDDSSGLLCGFVPASRGTPPAAPKAPSRPEHSGELRQAGPDSNVSGPADQRARRRAVRVLLHEPARLRRCGDRQAHPRRQAGHAQQRSPSPDGAYILVRRVKRPFSRLLTWNEFPQDVEVWNRSGEKVRTVADVPMADAVPMNGVITGPRAYRWHPLEPATLVWVEALDKGDIQNAVPHRDRIVTLESAVHRRADRSRARRSSATAARAGPTKARSC